jgi:beta-phosphoglucomutase-like phosphatase (HAD superfamily)
MAEPAYADLQVSLVLGRGLVVDTAPEHTKVAVGMLATTHLGIRLGEQVEYEITGYDPDDCTLTLRLAHDWRPGQKDAPEEPTP